MGAGFHLQSQILVRFSRGERPTRRIKRLNVLATVTQLINCNWYLYTSDFKFCSLLPHHLIEYITGSIVFKWLLIDFYMVLWGKHLRVIFKKLHVYMCACMCMHTHMCAWYECVGACVEVREQTCKGVLSLSSFPWICGLSSGCQACKSTFTYEPSQLL